MRPLDNILEGASLRLPETLVCNPLPKRKMRSALPCGFVPGLWVPGVHDNCTHNEVSALLMRSLAPAAPGAPAVLGSNFLCAVKRLRVVAKAYTGGRWSYRDVVNTYAGAMRRRYEEAERSLMMKPTLGRDDWLLKAFLKAEKLVPGKKAKPRMIFPRSPRFNLVLATWLKPFEHWLWGYLTAERLLGQKGNNTRVCAKGLSPRERGNLIARKFSRFRSCVVFEVDGKAFEAHVSRQQLVEEHSVYLSAFQGDRELHSVLQRQLFMKGYTATGVKFSRDGGRSSGDYNTGMGNTLLMLCCVVSAMQGRGVPYDVLADGDNAIIFLERSDYPGVRADFASRVFAECGHEMTLERPAFQLEDVRFGQSAPVYLGHGLGWTMVRDPRKVISHCLASHRWLAEPIGGKRWARGIAQCELSLARGVPVLQDFALKLLRATEGCRPLSADHYRDYLSMGARVEVDSSHAVKPTLEARVSFWRAWGIPPGEQETFVSSLPDPVFPSGWSPQVWREGPDCWRADPGFLEGWLSDRIFD
jgi:hypothetical protein